MRTIRWDFTQWVDGSAKHRVWDALSGVRRRLRWGFLGRSGVCLLVYATLLLHPADCQSLRWLGGPESNGIVRVSDDGATVAWLTGSFYYRAYVWRMGDAQPRQLNPGGYDTVASPVVTADGARVYFTRYNQYGFNAHALLYEPLSDTYTTLSGISSLGRYCWIQDITLDGQYVAGFRNIQPGGLSYYAFIGSTEGEGSNYLLSRSGYEYGVAFAISRTRNGLVVGGTVGPDYIWGIGDKHPAIWRLSAYGDQPEPEVIADVEGRGTLLALSANGKIGCGSTFTISAGTPLYAFVWFDGANPPIRYMPNLSANGRSSAYDITADGRTIVGISDDRAVRWRRTGDAFTIEDLNVTYAELLSSGSSLVDASSISSDGRYIAGYGYNGARGQYEVFLLDTGPCANPPDLNGDRSVDDADLLQVLFAFGQSGVGLPEDVNGDEVVDDADLLLVLFSFGVQC